jgi:acetyl esterase/lipase
MIMITLAYILSGISLLMSILLLIHLRAPLGWLLVFLKLPAGALSPVWVIMGLVGAVLGWAYQALWAIPMGVFGAGVMIWYVWRCTRDHQGFENAFGNHWKDQIPPEVANHMVQKRWKWYLKMNNSPAPYLEQDVPFWTIPGTVRELRCDIWRPGNGDVTGLALIYFHGGAWFFGDKDVGTRPFFHHLVAQGHTVMDVSYRLCPEVDICGMVGDAKRAIAWMKANASRFGVNPEKIVIGGGSAGGHLALLAGYAPGQPELTPDDLKSTDLSVCGVISYYGPKDFLTFYQYMNLQNLVGLPPVPIGKDLDYTKNWRYGGRLDILLGGWPEDAPHMYKLGSPINHVHPGCPPTLLIQGNHDVVCSMDATRALYAKLVESGVPVINLVLPWTAHAFDVTLPQVNPAAQSALYDVDRFLAILAAKN